MEQKSFSPRRTILPTSDPESLDIKYWPFNQFDSVADYRVHISLWHDVCIHHMFSRILNFLFEIISRENKPERVFGLQVRCRELDIFKILEMFWIFWGNFLVEFFGGFFGGVFFRRNFLEVFFVGFFWEDFFGRIFGEDFLERNSLVGIP